MNIFRLIFGLPMAALATLGLLGLMAAMINKQPPPPGKTRPALPSFTYEAPKQKAAFEVDVPAVPETPPPLDTTWDEPVTTPGAGGDGFRGPSGAPGKGTLDFPVIVSGPTIRVAPQYPSGCQSRGAEGTVIVQFDVTPEGNVVNPRIVDSANSCFDRTVLRTVSRWKYAPDTSSGKATMRRDVVETFVFTLEE